MQWFIHYTNTLKVYICLLLWSIIIVLLGDDEMELIKTFRDGNKEIENHIKIVDGMYTHRQIEKVGGKVFMRIKQRRLYERLTP